MDASRRSYPHGNSATLRSGWDRFHTLLLHHRSGGRTMKRLRSALLAMVLVAPMCVSLGALAVTDPVAGPKAPRIRTTPYDPQQVVRLTSTGLSPLEVIFEAGERAVTIAGALVFTEPKDAKDWLARPSGNVLILQPLRAVDPSVLFVRTAAADGDERHYAFELRTRDGS